MFPVFHLELQQQQPCIDALMINSHYRHRIELQQTAPLARCLQPPTQKHWIWHCVTFSTFGCGFDFEVIEQGESPLCDVCVLLVMKL